MQDNGILEKKSLNYDYKIESLRKYEFQNVTCEKVEFSIRPQSIKRIPVLRSITSEVMDCSIKYGWYESNRVHNNQIEWNVPAKEESCLHNRNCCKENLILSKGTIVSVVKRMDSESDTSHI